MWKLALALSAACFAQPTFELRGTVTDATTNQPLQDAIIDLVPGNGLVGPGIEVTSIQSDSQGAFVFRPDKPGQYVVRVRKTGYSRLSASLSTTPSDQSSARLTEQNPSAQFSFRLQRAGEISGTVIDDATEKPLPNFRIALANYTSTNGRPFARGGSLTTGPDGVFRSPSLASGQYLVQILPQVFGTQHIMSKFTADDIRATDLDYRTAFFPGGPEVENALPVQLQSGATVNMGTVRVKKQELNRVLISLDPASCPSGEPMTGTETAVFAQGSTATNLGTIPCGPILLTHVSPGTYEVRLSAGKAPDTVLAIARFTVTGVNLEVPARLSKGADLHGTIIAAKDAGELPLTKFKVAFAPVSGGIPQAEVQPHDVDAKGRFLFPSSQTARRRVIVTDLGGDYFVKEVRIGGQPAPGGLFDYSGFGELTIEIDRGPASLSGVVMTNDRPVPAADVVFMRWPPEPLDDREAIRHLKPAADGKFQLEGIVPGEYRIFAVAAAESELAQQPAPWQRLTARAQKLTLTKGPTQALTLQLADAAR